VIAALNLQMTFLVFYNFIMEYITTQHNTTWKQRNYERKKMEQTSKHILLVRMFVQEVPCNEKCVVSFEQIPGCSPVKYHTADAHKEGIALRVLFR
jgi:hypothetical protein